MKTSETFLSAMEVEVIVKVQCPFCLHSGAYTGRGGEHSIAFHCIRCGKYLGALSIDPFSVLFRNAPEASAQKELIEQNGMSDVIYRPL